MEINPGQFQYNPSLIDSYPFNLASPDFIALGTLTFLLATFFLLHVILPYFHGYALIRNEEKVKAEKKKTIQDLIMMKEIQSELEKEIEQALLKHSLKSN